MAQNSLGLTEGVSIALGGMIGGGIFAVLGVVAQMTRAVTWFAFVLAGTVALCAAYSFNTLNELSDGQGGAVTFVQCFLGNSTLAGMTGWTLLVGYIGSMAMYAYAFGSFTVGLALIPDSIASYPSQPIISVLTVAAFVGLNLLGVQATGSETIGTILNRTGETTYRSADDVYTRLIGTVGDAYIGRKYYDDRGGVRSVPHERPAAPGDE